MRKMRKLLYLMLVMFLVIAGISYADISLVSPPDGAITNNSAVRFTYTPTNNQIISNCSLIISGSIDQTSSSITLNQQNYFDKSLADGNYSWGIICQDTSSIIINSATYKFEIDTTPPNILSYSPTAIINLPTTTLSIITNENATCKYSSIANASYSAMSDFETSKGKTHTVLLSSLTDRSYDYYIKCADMIGNIMNSDYPLSFEVSLLPTAEITLSDSSPVKAGIIEITVVTSKNMKETPSLSYSYDDSTEKKQIPLTGSNSLWEGLIVIQDSNEKKIGAFHFQGTDTKGNIGTFITEGRLFIIDTIEPNAPADIKAVSDKNGDIKLKWYYQDEDIDHCNIYRSTTSGITYLDYYTSQNGTQYTDRSVVDKVSYYYRVALVDSAGNIGPLSPEVYATSLAVGAQTPSPQNNEETKTPKVLPPNLVPKVDKLIKRIDGLLIDIKDTSSRFSDSKDASKEIIDELDLVAEVSKVDSKLNALKEQLAGLKLTYRTEGELDTELSKIDLDIKKVEKTTPKEVTLLEKSDYVQSLGEDDIERAVNELLLGSGVEDNTKKEIIANNKKSQKDLKVEAKIRSIEIRYMDETKAQKTLIQKKITHTRTEPLEDVIVMEIIPKEVAESTDEIEFVTQDYEIVKKDPIVKWGFVKLSSDGDNIKYIINKKAGIEDAQLAKSVVITNLNLLSTSPATGYTVFSQLNLSTSQKTLIILGTVIIIVLSGYYFTFVKGKRGKESSDIEDELSYYPGFGQKKSSPNPKKIQQYRNDKISRDRAFNGLFNFSNKNPEKNLIIEEKLSAVQSLINQANQLLDDGQNDHAILIYDKVNWLYRNLPPEIKAEIYESCMELHQRISEK